MEKLRLLQIDLTDECPLFCSHCSNSSGPSRRLTFPFTSLKAVIVQAGMLEVETLVFSGGEPLCYPQVHDALLCAQSQAIPVTLFTTGITDASSRLPISVADWTALASAGLRTAAFSVYSSPQCRDVHNAIVRLRPRTGDAFAANENAIASAYSAGIDVQVHYIPSTRSLGSLADIHKWAEKLHCSVLHVQMPVLQGRNEVTKEVRVEVENEQLLAQEVRDLSEKSNTAVRVSRFWKYQWDWISALEQENRNQLIVRADGTVSICNACKYLNGYSLRENILLSGRSLIDIWNDSAEAVKRHNCLEGRSHDKRAKADGGRTSVYTLHANVPVS
jgi:MoaA/NifB/PqqE/SkfB family radical SAM enzyme